MYRYLKTMPKALFKQDMLYSKHDHRLPKWPCYQKIDLSRFIYWDGVLSKKGCKAEVTGETISWKREYILCQFWSFTVHDGVHLCKVENIQDSFQLSHQIHLKFRPCNAQRNFEKPKSYRPQTLQASVGMLNIKVHDSTIRNRLNRLKYGLFGRVIGESLFSLKRTWQHSLGL